MQSQEPSTRGWFLFIFHGWPLAPSSPGHQKSLGVVSESFGISSTPTAHTDTHLTPQYTPLTHSGDKMLMLATFIPSGYQCQARTQVTPQINVVSTDKWWHWQQISVMELVASTLILPSCGLDFPTKTVFLPSSHGSTKDDLPKRWDCLTAWSMPDIPSQLTWIIPTPHQTLALLPIGISTT